MKYAFISIFFFILAGCTDQSTGPDGSSPYEKWRSRNLHNYSMEQIRSCFCGYGGVRMKVIVRSDTIFSVTRIDDSTVLPAEAARRYLTVDSLFGIIKNPGSDSLVVSYHVQMGFPESLDIDPQLHPVDGGVLYVTSNVQPMQ